MDEAQLRRMIAAGMSIEAVARELQRDASTVAYWMRKHGIEAPNREKYAAKGGLDRKVLKELVEAGCTIAEIAAAVGRSAGTVRHWLRRYALRTAQAQGRLSRVEAERARADGLRYLRRRCRTHGEAEFVIESGGRMRCKRCRSDRVAARRRKVKAILVAEAGGACVICGYHRHPAALEFHHVDPSQKRIGLSYRGLALAIATLRVEAQKCVLLCSNCHAEVEAGVSELPLDLPSRTEARRDAPP